MDTTEQVAAEISKYLRGYQGAQDFGRLRSCPALLTALGTDDAAEAFRRLKAALADLGTTRDLKAIGNALNIKPVRSGTALQRRTRLAEMHDVSVSAIKQWEARGIAALARYVAVDGQSETLAEVELIGWVHDCEITKARVVKTYRGRFDSLRQDVIELEANQENRTRRLAYGLHHDEQPDIFIIQTHWSGRVPGCHHIYEHPSLLHLGLGAHSSLVHYSIDDNHSPMPERTRRVIATPQPNTVYSITWYSASHPQTGVAPTPIVN